MRLLLLAAIAVCCTAANADVYKCPATYPDKDRPSTPLTGARIMDGELHGNGWLMGSEDKPTKDGFDTVYSFEQGNGWLVCLYGGRERTKTDRGFPGYDWWLKLGPKEILCTVQNREIKASGPNSSTWTVTAKCTRQP